MQMQMRILIQHCLSHLFLAPNDQWIADEKKALTFESTALALKNCLKRADKNHLQIVLKFSEGDLDVALPIKESDCL
jgi:hypothetical protein